MGKKDLPKKWIGCPKSSTQLIADKFFCFKTPLSENLNNSVPEEEEFTIQNVFDAFEKLSRGSDKKLKIWINLTNTDKYFDGKVVENAGLEYHHMKVFGGPDALPKQYLIDQFKEICSSVEDDEKAVIGVHCTHGFNRTGFFICAYLTEVLGHSIDEAIVDFKTNRPPGIYRAGLLSQLVDKYGGSEISKILPIQPSWSI